MRRTPLLAVSRIGILAVLGLLLALVALPAGAAVRAQSTTTGSGASVAELEQRLRDARAASDAAVERFQQATAKHESLVDEISAVEERMAVGRARAAELRVIAVDRAVTAYTSREVDTDVATVVLGSGDVMKELRRRTLLEHANADDNAAIDELRVLEEDLGIQRGELQDKRAEAKVLVDRLESEKASLAATVTEAQRAYDELVDRLAREAESRAAAERAARAVTAPTNFSTAAPTSRSTPAPSGTPVAGFLCPVRGSFTNDFGDPRSGGRSHAGIDIFAGTGTPVVAVKSGTISFQQGGAGGNAVYLSADDGNGYYYAHLSAYAGGARSVSQGEVIGYVGQTGSATAPHLHIEIRTPGGIVNPYATLAASC